MTDYLIIEPDGETTEDEGRPHGEVGCHGVDGVMLWNTRKYVDGVRFTYRLLECLSAWRMPDEHPENPVANAVLTGLGYPHKVRGRIAIVQVMGITNELMPFTPKQLEGLRRLVVVGRSLTEHRIPPKAVSIDDKGGVQISINTLLEGGPTK